MTTGKDVFRRNGEEIIWASATLKVIDEEMFGVTAVDYEEKLERSFARGLGRDQAPRGITTGAYSVEGSSIKLYKASAMALLEMLALKSPDGKSYGRTPFYFVLQYVEEDVSITEELFGCKVSGRKVSAAPGADGLIDEVPITVQYAKLSTGNVQGMTLFDNRAGRF